MARLILSSWSRRSFTMALISMGGILHERPPVAETTIQIFSAGSSRSKHVGNELDILTVGYFHSADSRTYLPSSTAVLRKTIQLCFTRQDTCARKIEMKKRKDPPGYPGDEAILKAFGDALRDVRIEKGLSLEQADAVFQEALKRDLYPRLPRALGIVVRELREKQNMSRQQLCAASGLSVRFLSSLERGQASNATLTQIVRISFGLNYPITDLVTEVEAVEKRLRSE